MALKILNETLFTRNSILNEKYCPKHFEHEVKSADLLILPYENFKDLNIYHFSDETFHFFYFLKEKNIKTELCIDENNFNTLQLHSDEFRFSHMFLGSFLLPLFSNLLGEFISTKIKNSQKKTPSNISIELTIEKNNKNINLKFDGPIDNFFEVLKEINREE